MPFPTIFRRKKLDSSRSKAEAASSDGIENAEFDQWSRMKSEYLILVMGVTGAGKSYFINRLKENSVIEGHGLRSRKCPRNTFQSLSDSLG
jgi:predicted GTPase